MTLQRLQRYGIQVEARPTTADERAAIEAERALAREGLAHHLTGAREAGMFGVVATVVLVPAALFLPFERDAALLRVAVGAFWLVLAGIAVAGAVRGARMRRERLEAFDAETAEMAASVQELRFQVARVLAVSDSEVEGNDWWFFEIAHGFLVIMDWDGAVALRDVPWRRTVRLALDGDEEIRSVATEGDGVPLVDRRHQPGVRGEPPPILWTPPDDFEPPLVITRNELAAHGEWPPGLP